MKILIIEIDGQCQSLFLQVGLSYYILKDLIWINLFMIIQKNFTLDIKYPEKLDDSHNGYPLAPKKIEVTEDIFLW